MQTIAQLRPTAGAYAEDPTFQSLMARNATFSPEVYHTMQERDNALIRDELLNGAASKAFVYEFTVAGNKVTGISVVGARELAAQYKGIKSRIVATVEKKGALFIFRTFSPLSIETRWLTDLEAEDDFYECVMEVSDIKTGNSIEVRKKESRTERKRDGSVFERPHYDVIAESKAYRNGVLSVLPQSVIREFMKRCLAAGNSSTEETIDQRRAKVQTFAAKNGIRLDRQVLAGLSVAELDGLGGAARESLDAFRRSGAALGLWAGADNADPATGEIPPPPPPAAATPPAPRPAATRTPAAAAPPPAPAQQVQPFDADAFAALVDAAVSTRELDALASELQQLEDLETAQVLNDMVIRRRSEIEPAGPAAAPPPPAASTTAAAGQRRARVAAPASPME